MCVFNRVISDGLFLQRYESGFDQHVLALCASLTGVISDGLFLQKIVFDVCICSLMTFVCNS